MEYDLLQRRLNGSDEPNNLPFPLLKSITANFSEERQIGKGGFGTVYKGILPNQTVIAVKRITNNHTFDDKLFHREVGSLLTINHQNVVRFLGFCSSTEQTAMKYTNSGGYIYPEMRERLLCFEYVSNGGLDEHITDELRGLEWRTRYLIIRGICEGLHHLHDEKHIIHMDLKPANILLDVDMVPKITDFGLSRLDVKSQAMTANLCFSRGYCAPEYLHEGRMSVKSDIFSLGVIIMELVTGRKYVRDYNYDERSILEKKKWQVQRKWSHRWKKSGKPLPLGHQQVTKCIEIGLLCQEKNPRKRPSISEILGALSKMETMNANESTAGQVSPYLEEDMLGVEPLELCFHFEPNKQIPCSLLLSNDNQNAYIAFMIEPPSLSKFRIQPSKGIVAPQSKCIINVTLPAQEKAPQHPQHARDEFVVHSSEVDEGLADEDITVDIFDKDAADEINLSVVYDAPPLHDEDKPGRYTAQPERATSGFNDDEKPAGSTKGLVLMKPVKYLKEDAAMTADTVTAEVEINAASSTAVREGLDLVAVLDVSGSMRGDKMESMKMAMQFVIKKLTPEDRLSIVTFSNDATRHCPLRSMTATAQDELTAIVDRLSAHGRTNLKSGLETGLAVFAERANTHARTANIFLMSDGTQTNGDAREVDPGLVSVYTFGFGKDTDHQLMSDIAKASPGGTFSSVVDGAQVSLPFSQLLAGLLTVVAQDVQLALTPKIDEGDVDTIEVAPGTDYTQTTDAATGVITIKFGTIFAREGRRVVISLVLKESTATEQYKAILAEAQHSYTVQGILQNEAPQRIQIHRTRNPTQVPGASSKVRQLQAELARRQHAQSISQARVLADCHNLAEARYKLTDAQNALEDIKLNDGQKLVNSLRAELQQLVKLMETQELYVAQGRAYALASASSHGRQRFAARGDDVDGVRLFSTPRMDTYLEQAKYFEEDPTAPVPSADEDV